MTLDWICRRLAEGDGNGDGDGHRRVKGDHELTPGALPPSSLTPAAVLVLLVDHADGMTVVFTRRTDHLAHHPGQISFPGGHIEPDDDGFVATALREAEEEIGLSPDGVEIVGRLSPYVTRTGFHITPVVGVVKPPLTFYPDPHEVAEIFEVPLEFLLDPANHRRYRRSFEGGMREYYAFPYGDYFIWGATAGMVMELYERLKQP